MKATELIEQLYKLVKEHGDAEVYSQCDYDFVGHIYFGESSADCFEPKPSDNPNAPAELRRSKMFVLEA